VVDGGELGDPGPQHVLQERLVAPLARLEGALDARITQQMKEARTLHEAAEPGVNDLSKARTSTAVCTRWAGGTAWPGHQAVVGQEGRRLVASDLSTDAPISWQREYGRQQCDSCTHRRGWLGLIMIDPTFPFHPEPCDIFPEADPSMLGPQNIFFFQTLAVICGKSAHFRAKCVL
jgi:hypothetical protein